MSKYSILIDSVMWTYDGKRGLWVRGRTPGQWAIPSPDRPMTAAEWQMCADVVAQYERDHTPRTRRRVVRCSQGLYWARHQTLSGFVYGATPESARHCALNQRNVDAINASDGSLAMLADLKTRPDEEVPDGE